MTDCKGCKRPISYGIDGMCLRCYDQTIMAMLKPPQTPTSKSKAVATTFPACRCALCQSAHSVPQPEMLTVEPTVDCPKCKTTNPIPPQGLQVTCKCGSWWQEDKGWTHGKRLGALRVFRYWNVDENEKGESRLGATAFAYRWEPGENVAAMDPKLGGYGGHGPGFYGFGSIGELFHQEPQSRSLAWGRVAGTILCYGRVHVHKHGVRAEKAIVESLIEPKELDQAFKVVQLADHYQCRIISMETAQNLQGGLVPYRKDQEL